MINRFIAAIAKKLKEMFPDKSICVDELSQNAEGKIFIIVNTPSQTKGLGTLRKRSAFFDISYVCKENDNTDYYDWIDKMYDNLEYVEADGRIYKMKNLRGEKFDGIYHFLFDIDYYIYKKGEEPKMASLKQNGGMKND